MHGMTDLFQIRFSMDKQYQNVKTFHSDFLMQTKSPPEMERFLVVLNRMEPVCCERRQIKGKNYLLFTKPALARTDWEDCEDCQAANKQVVPRTAEKDASGEIKEQQIATTRRRSRSVCAGCD